MALDERAKRPYGVDPVVPPITLHMVLARQIALDLDSAQLAPTSGHYLLGATSPDIRR